MENYIQEMELYFELKNTRESSRESYRRRVKAFLEYMETTHRDTVDISEKNIQEYILFLKNDKGLSAGTINNYISSIRFFYTHVLDKEWNKRKIPRMRRTQKLPVILPKETVLELLDTATNLKHKAILAMIYGSGLRVSEVARLKISDICSKTMQVRVDNAKHDTNRYTILSQAALQILREYFRANSSPDYKPEDWLFPGQKQGNHLNVKSIKNTMIKLRNKLGLGPGVSAHTLRHCFATHSLEDGVELALIQQMLGHKSIKTTAAYLHMTSKMLMGIKSPLDRGGDRK